MAKFDRRQFLKLMGMAGLTAVAPLPLRRAYAQSTGPYTGPLYVQIAAEGGWDVTSFCDPKVNPGGAPIINQWATTSGVQTIAGSPIEYAPYAVNQALFDRFHDDMLVVNGVDALTESHDTGVRHNWSGRISPGYPSWAALVASAYGTEMPLGFITNGGYRETAGLTQYTLLGDTGALRNLARPNAVPWGDNVYHEADELDVITRYRSERLAALRSDTDLLPRTQANMDALLQARSTNNQLIALADILPDELVSSTDTDGNTNYLLQQAQLALLCFQAGVSVSAHLQMWGFDTHEDHDAEHHAPLSMLVRGIEYLWDTAEAMGIDDRLVVVVNSEFGRTPWYNDENGKDHWPIGSTLFMRRGVDWTNRVIGATTETHEAQSLDPTTLQISPSGVRIEPKDIQQALRTLAGIESHANAALFPLNDSSFDFFDASLGSTQTS